MQISNELRTMILRRKPGHTLEAPFYRSREVFDLAPQIAHLDQRRDGNRAQAQEQQNFHDRNRPLRRTGACWTAQPMAECTGAPSQLLAARPGRR